jgi:hypothetical protein
MHDDIETLEKLRLHSSHLASTQDRLPKKADNPAEDGGEEACAAFGYLRGSHERALAVEFRLRTGNREYYSYSHLSSWRFNPSVGLLLKFNDDVVTLVLIRGSNVDAVVGNRSMNLTDRGFQRHKVLWVREMDEDELRRAGKGEPTIDRIEVAECESNEAVTEWLNKHAPAFLRK